MNMSMYEYVNVWIYYSVNKYVNILMYEVSLSHALLKIAIVKLNSLCFQASRKIVIDKYDLFDFYLQKYKCKRCI